MHFALAERQSAVFRQALEPKTQKYIDHEWQEDSLAGKLCVKRNPQMIGSNKWFDGIDNVLNVNVGNLRGRQPFLDRVAQILLALAR